MYKAPRSDPDQVYIIVFFSLGAGSCCLADSGMFYEPCQLPSTLAARVCFHVVPMGVMTVHHSQTDISHLRSPPQPNGLPGRVLRFMGAKCYILAANFSLCVSMSQCLAAYN